MSKFISNIFLQVLSQIVYKYFFPKARRIYISKLVLRQAYTAQTQRR